MAATKAESRVVGLFEQAVGTFGDALKSGVKIQEEVGKFWTDALDQVPAQDWQRKSRAMIADAIPAARRNVEEWLKLVEDNSRRSVTLLKRAFDSDQLEPGELQERTQELWQETLEMVRNNAQAVAQSNVKLLEVWAELLRKNAAEGVKAAVAAAK